MIVEPNINNYNKYRDNLGHKLKRAYKQTLYINVCLYLIDILSEY